MKKYLYSILLAVSCYCMYSCTKPETKINNAGTKLIMVKTDVLDSVGNNCSNCFVYQLFSYNEKGQLTRIKDSTNDPYYIFIAALKGPVVYNSTGSHNYYKSIEYNGSGNLFRATRDSFVYNSNGRLIERYRRVQCETCKSYLNNRYTYDSNGRLIADSAYAGATALVPTTYLHEYRVFTYDANDNVIKYDLVNVVPGTYPVTSSTTQYDDKLSPYKAFGIIAYLAYDSPFVLSKSNVFLKGYTAEYYPNGLPKKISYNGHVQEFFYQ